MKALLTILVLIVSIPSFADKNIYPSDLRRSDRSRDVSVSQDSKNRNDTRGADERVDTESRYNEWDGIDWGSGSESSCNDVFLG